MAFLPLLLPFLLEEANHEIKAENTETCHICPIGSVPESGDEEGDENAETPPVFVDAAAHHGVVDIVHEPCGKRDVVAFPIFLH